MRVLYFCLLGTLASVVDSHASFNDDVQKLIKKTVKSCQHCPSVILSVKSPKLGINFQTARSGDQVLKNPGRVPFRLASITKTFTAILVYQLAESKKISLDDRFSAHLPPSMIQGLHVINGVDRTKEITIRQALFHTSGLGHHFHREDSSAFFDEYASKTKKRWTPHDVLESIRGKLRAHFVPGADFYYSDAGYLLLGLLIEHVSKEKLTEVYKRKISKTIGLATTRMEIEKSSGPRMSPVFYGKRDTSTWASISADWAAGGLVSTTDDLDAFIRAVFKDDLLVSSASRADMTRWKLVDSKSSVFYGGGIGARKTAIGQMVGHSGATGSFVRIQPELDLTIAGTFNQYDFDHSKFEDELIDLIAKLVKKD